MMLLSTAKATGSAHTRPGLPGKTNNQDAIATRTVNQYKVIVLADGCGSQPHSEVGADIGANLAARMIADQLRDNDSVDWENLGDQIADSLTPFIELYDDSFDDVLLTRFMFTLIAIVIDKENVTVAAFGDGLIVKDDEILDIDIPIKNTPPYLGYLMREESPYHEAELRPYLQFRPIFTVALQDIKKSLVVATDGLDAVPLNDIHHPGLLAKSNALQFWLNTHAIEQVEDGKIVSGICGDDVTMVMIRTEEAQARLVKSRTKIVKLKSDIQEFIEEVKKTYKVWDNNPLLEKDAREEMENLRSWHVEFSDQAKTLDAVLDCEDLLADLKNELDALDKLDYKKEPIVITFSTRVGKITKSFVPARVRWWDRGFMD